MFAVSCCDPHSTGWSKFKRDLFDFILMPFRGGSGAAFVSHSTQSTIIHLHRSPNVVN